MADSKKYGRTANLIDYNYLFSDDYDRRSEFFAYYRLDVSPNTQYTLSSTAPYDVQRSETTFMIGLTNVQTTSENGVFGTKTVTTDSNGVLYVAIRIKSGFIPATDINDYTSGTYYIMLNTGSTALPYQPYLDWQHSLRKLGTATDTITTLPADVYADGNNATVGLVGNTSQTGTPTPQNPITPQETGERTGNLFDLTTAILGKYIDNQGIEQTSSSGITNHSDYIEIIPDTAYTISVTKPSYNSITSALSWYDSSKNFLYRSYYALPAAEGRYSWNANSPNNAKYCILNFTTYPNFGNEKDMFNTGSTALPYEPYGYKLTISSASTTTPVYLGEVETTRKIKKYEFTGTESGYVYSAARRQAVALYVADVEGGAGTTLINALCTHYVRDTRNNLYNNTAKGFSNASEGGRIIFFDTDYQTLESFKAFLKDQYDAGTPVCVWYVLATEETAVVNEPIRKIGDYADTVSGITIPTITGKDTFDVLTTLKPSEVSLTYTGWHDTTVKEWDGSQWD